jgi:hypothetical protein
VRNHSLNGVKKHILENGGSADDIEIEEMKDV